MIDFFSGIEEASLFSPTHVRQLRIREICSLEESFLYMPKAPPEILHVEKFLKRGVLLTDLFREGNVVRFGYDQCTDFFLRGYKLGALILDSCSNPAYALNQSLDFVRDMIGSTDASEYQCSDGKQPMPTNRNGHKKSVVAVVGASYSSVTVQVISPASTNADLSDKSRFEYFARTVPSDNYQARAMIDIASHFNWSYVSLVYSADEYGELGADAFKKEARRANICIAIEERISMKPESLSESVGNLVKKLQSDKKLVLEWLCCLLVRSMCRI
uniref:Receptor ligand binding region domain-containing protein n=1 Tax=Ditylenchus dipsaci TaxID=166011 RepID=A0A915D9M5_9BILA